MDRSEDTGVEKIKKGVKDMMYDDIINLPHHVSKKHPQMSIYDRAAQFGRFSPLNGYDEAVEETARYTEERIEIDEELQLILNEKLQEIEKNIKTSPKVTITYFVPDEKKQGGKYEKITGNVKKIDKYTQNIVLTDMRHIPIKEITKIELGI